MREYRDVRVAKRPKIGNILFASVSTECFSHHQGGSQLRSHHLGSERSILQCAVCVTVIHMYVHQSSKRSGRSCRDSIAVTST